MPASLAGIINLLIWLLSLAIIGRALISWVDPKMQSPVARFLYDLTEPIIAPIRRHVPSLGMIDLSPFIALLLLQLLGRVLLSATA